MSADIFSVRDINLYIQSLLDNSSELKNLAVRGEISNFKTYPSGHCYFTLKDSESTISCVMFRSAAARLRFRPENGMKVLLRGRVSVFVKTGAYQLYCETITPAGTGELAVAFEQLKAQLYAQGLFDPARKRVLPAYPERVVIITSPAGAAVHDMIRILKKRWPIAKIILLPVQVQGEDAPPAIASAIDYADRKQLGDVIITGRGGGSIEDLWAFNTEQVARAIYRCQTPIVSAVGHEPDVTIADFVADVRAATPSNAAEIVSPDQTELRRRIQHTYERLLLAEQSRLQFFRQEVNILAQKRVLCEQSAYLQDRRMHISHLRQRLSDVFSGLLSRKRQQLAPVTSTLYALNPLDVLGRGYAIARDQNEQIIKHYRDIRPGASAVIILGEGGFTCTIESVFP